MQKKKTQGKIDRKNSEGKSRATIREERRKKCSEIGGVGCEGVGRMCLGTKSRERERWVR